MRAMPFILMVVLVGTFARSRRRLELLRHLLPQIKYLGTGDYIASGIGKLEALPASDLTE